MQLQNFPVVNTSGMDIKQSYCIVPQPELSGLITTVRLFNAIIDYRYPGYRTGYMLSQPVHNTMRNVLLLVVIITAGQVINLIDINTTTG